MSVSLPYTGQLGFSFPHIFACRKGLEDKTYPAIN